MSTPQPGPVKAPNERGFRAARRDTPAALGLAPNYPLASGPNRQRTVSRVVSFGFERKLNRSKLLERLTGLVAWLDTSCAIHAARASAIRDDG